MYFRKASVIVHINQNCHLEIFCRPQRIKPKQGLEKNLYSQGQQNTHTCVNQTFGKAKIRMLKNAQ